MERLTSARQQRGSALGSFFPFRWPLTFAETNLARTGPRELRTVGGKDRETVPTNL